MNAQVFEIIQKIADQEVILSHTDQQRGVFFDYTSLLSIPENDLDYGADSSRRDLLR
jgi:hypothetical protein